MVHSASRSPTDLGLFQLECYHIGSIRLCSLASGCVSGTGTCFDSDFFGRSGSRILRGFEGERRTPNAPLWCVGR
jgi:hypothetical protein